jgi:hypothetical protein
MHRPDQHFCSKSCAQTWRNLGRPSVPLPARPPDYERSRQLAKSRARHLRHAQTWDGITDEEILDRDGWRCQIPGCRRRPIRKDLKSPHLRSKSVDHIIPLSLGGDDTAVNKRAAHLGCNMARSNRMTEEQLPLFGVVREPPLVTRTASGATIRPPRVPRLCDVCSEPLVGGKCRLHSPVYFLACEHCGALFAAQRRAKRFCGTVDCNESRWSGLMLSVEARERKRLRDRQRMRRLRTNPETLQRVRENNRRSYARRKWDKAAPVA